MTIKELGFELYKITWFQQFSTEQKLDWMRNYYDDCKKFNDFSATPKEVFEEFGFDGEHPSCFDEFVNNEYKDKNYMRTLFNDSQYREYLVDTEKDGE